MWVIQKTFNDRVYTWGANGFQTDTTFARHYMEKAKAEEHAPKLDLMHYAAGWTKASVVEV